MDEVRGWWDGGGESCTDQAHPRKERGGQIKDGLKRKIAPLNKS